MGSLADLPSPAALIFDLDGTLVDTVGTRIDAWLATFAEAGIPAERDRVARLIGADGKKLARDVAMAAGYALDDKEADRIDRRSGAVYDGLNTSPRPIAGARELLLALEASDLSWAVATSSLAAQVSVSIAALELPHAPLIVDGSHVEHAKPAPDLLLLAAERLATPPAGCWYIGDATWDMLAARAAGTVAVGMAYGAATSAELEHVGAHVTTSFSELSAELRGRGLIAG